MPTPRSWTFRWTRSLGGRFSRPCCPAPWLITLCSRQHLRRCGLADARRGHLGAAGALLLAAIYRVSDAGELFIEVLRRTISISSMILFIVLGGRRLHKHLHDQRRERPGSQGVVAGLDLGPTGLVILLLAIVFVIGFTMDWVVGDPWIAVPISPPIIRDSGLDRRLVRACWSLHRASDVLLHTAHGAVDLLPGFHCPAGNELSGDVRGGGWIPFVGMQHSGPSDRAAGSGGRDMATRPAVPELMAGPAPLPVLAAVGWSVTGLTCVPRPPRLPAPSPGQEMSSTAVSSALLKSL